MKTLKYSLEGDDVTVSYRFNVSKELSNLFEGGSVTQSQFLKLAMIELSNKEDRVVVDNSEEDVEVDGREFYSQMSI